MSFFGTLSCSAIVYICLLILKCVLLLDVAPKRENSFLLTQVKWEMLEASQFLITFNAIRNPGWLFQLHKQTYKNNTNTMTFYLFVDFFLFLPFILCPCVYVSPPAVKKYLDCLASYSFFTFVLDELSFFKTTVRMNTWIKGFEHFLKYFTKIYTCYILA